MSESAITTEQASWIHQVISYIAGGIATAVGWLWRGAQRKVNAHSKRIAELERTSITRDDLNDAITQFNTQLSPRITSIQEDVRTLVNHMLDKQR